MEACEGRVAQEDLLPMGRSLAAYMTKWLQDKRGHGRGPLVARCASLGWLLFPYGFRTAR